ncbi:hypothetical protein [Streptomyces sp. NPDC091383]|uniref:hypothetical protein n=1 Tax=Streptomyces sp. NPDC091383 TaxID=3365996 RepID=UPI0038285F10
MHPAHTTDPAHPVRIANPGRPGRRPLPTALAVAACLSLFAGIGWLAAHPGGGGVAAGGADQGAKRARPGEDARRPACAVTVVEGTVARVEPRGSGDKVTVTVVRSYEPARGPAEVAFPLGGEARPAPRPGQHVLVEAGHGGREASRWTVGDAAVAAERARIEAAPHESRSMCPGAGKAAVPR